VRVLPTSREGSNRMKRKTYYIAEQIIEMKRKLEIKKQVKNTYTITAEVDEQWFEILGQITRHQEGFVWIGVKNETTIPSGV
jgi:hypothetical protein